ncbi:MAG TPA: methyltransferase [Propionibacteriaceae bacterium]|nr:methyltransferase [Propionibacteriaceae bacterium]
MLSAEICAELRSALSEHGYTVDRVVEAIGEQAHRALGRNTTVVAARALGDRDDPLAVLTSMWPLQRSVSRSALDRALPGLVGPLAAAGILRQSGNQVHAEVDIRPYASDDGAGGWIVSDLSPNLDTHTAPVRPDFVLGVSSASTTLAQLTLRHPVRRALDLGTGCGVQTLHLARHAQQVVATDLNPRALAMAELTLGLNRVTADLRLGSLFQPVADERFDLITTNPPYVMSPPGKPGQRLTYREGDYPADGLVEQVVRHGPDQLTDGGTLQVLANWAHPAGDDWRQRLYGWIAATGCDAHVVQREALDVDEYVELWLADAGLAGSADYVRRYDAWLDYFEQLGVEAVGMGWIVLRRAGRSDPQIEIEDWPHPLEQPIGPAVADGFQARELEQDLSGDELLGRRWRLAVDVLEESTGAPGAGDPEHIVHRQQRGFRRAVAVDTALGGILGACDGELSLGQIIASVAEILEVPPGMLLDDVVPALRRLVRQGFLG